MNSKRPDAISSMPYRRECFLGGGSPGNQSSFRNEAIRLTVRCFPLIVRFPRQREYAVAKIRNRIAKVLDKIADAKEAQA